MDENWPSDILTEILLKLPVKSIIRFKCVAKTWCHLFQNPRFISQHHSISKKNKRLVVCYQYYDHTGSDDKLVMRLFVDQALVSYHDLHQCLPSPFTSSKLFEFCVDNGLFCLHDLYNYVLALWNPATREFKILPLPQCNQNFPISETMRGYIGFGLDPLSNDYKVIYIRSHFYLEEFVDQYTYNYAIYSMNTDSWRVSREEDVEFLKEYWFCNSKSFVNGVYYWLLSLNQIFEFSSSWFKVLAFNLSTENFQLIDSPFPKTGGNLFPLHDRIAISDTNLIPEMEISNKEVWVLNDEGLHWTKVLKIELVLQVDRNFGFWKNDKLLVESKTYQLLLYDLENDEAKEVDILTNDEGRGVLQVHTYEESLVAIEKE